MQISSRRGLQFKTESGPDLHLTSNGVCMEWILLLLVAIILFPIARKLDKEGQKKGAEHIAEMQAQKNMQFRDKVTPIIQQHIHTLTIKYRQSRQVDDYGNLIFDKWFTEIHYFLDSVVANSVDLSGERRSDARMLVIEMVVAYDLALVKQGTPLPLDIEQMAPIDFEHFCADILRGCGWEAQVTQATGDQGIDVIAKWGEVKAVLQCKKYSQPVGNSAVQEVFAGKQFEGANIAAVVSNAPYTPAAKQLASSTGVHLLHYSELELFAEKLEITAKEPPNGFASQLSEQH